MRVLLACIAAIIAPLATEAAAQEPENPAPADFAGNWMGTLDVGAAQLRLRFVVTEDEGALSVAVFSLDQGNTEIPNVSIAASGATITVRMPAAGASYEGTFSAEDGKITGTFTQAGADFPLVLERVSEEETDVSRPQDPVEPYPYLAEDVTYPNPDGGHTMAGTFTRPADGGPFPAVILISGSGPQNRDGAALGHSPFLVLADHLTRRGIAVLRYDDRGVGGSTGDFGTATSQDFATDALAAVAYLKGRDDVDPGRIGLAGHSEGGVIAPMVAVESPDVSYIVLMAAPGVRGETLAYAQTELIARAGGVSEETIAEIQETSRAVFEVLKSESDLERAGEAIAAVFQASGTEVRGQDGITVEQLMTSLASDAWLRFFLAYEPAEMIEQVTVPVLAIHGEKDLQVPHEENLREIEAALQRGGNTRYEIHSFPDLNHLFQNSETGAPSEYQAIEETWSVEVMEVIADWILKTVGG